MGDALAIATLGIEACKGLVTAISRLTSFTDDIQNAVVQTQDLTSILFALKNILEKTDVKDRRYTAVQKCMLDCADGVNKLNEKVMVLRQGESGGFSFGKPAIQRIAYVFRKTHFDDLRKSVEELHQRLNTSIQVHELGTIMELAAEIRQICQHDKADFEALLLEIASIKSRIQDQEALITGSIDRLRPGIRDDLNLEINKLGNLVKNDLTDTIASSTDLIQSNNNLALSKYLAATSPSYQADLLDQTYLSEKFKRDKRNQNRDGVSNASEFKWTVSLFSKSVTLSFAATVGAGGFSISPLLTLKGRSVSSDSPAFTALSYIHEGLTNCIEEGGDMNSVLQDFIRELEGIFRRGEGSPSDKLGEEYLTLTHIAMMVFFYLSFLNTIDDHVWVTFFRSMKELGVPLSELDIWGETPLGFVFRRYKEDVSLPESKLVDLGLQNIFISGRIMSRMLPKPSYGLLYDEFVAEEYGCGPVALAVVSGDIARLRRILKRYSGVSEKINEVGTLWMISALHIACLKNWVEAVKCLMDAGADPNPFEAFRSSLDYATYWSSLEVVKELIPDNKAWPANALDHELYDLVIGAGVDKRVLPYLIQNLKNRRLELTEILADKLLPDELWALRKDENVLLDCLPRMVWDVVSQRTEIPEKLVPNSFKSVYTQKRMTVEAAELLWQAGFRDIECAQIIPPSMKESVEIFRNATNYYPLANIASTLTGMGGPFDRESCELIKWYLSKGRSLNRLANTHNNTTTAHILTYYLGKTVRKMSSVDTQDSGRDNDEYAEVVECLILQDSQKSIRFLKDNCACLCTASGCSWFTTYLHGAARSDHVNSVQASTNHVIAVASNWLKHLDVSAEDVKSVWLEGIRYILFHHLRLRHTCCIDQYRGEELRSLLLKGSAEVKKAAKKLERLTKLAEEGLKGYSKSFASFVENFSNEYAIHLDNSEDVVIEGDEDQDNNESNQDTLQLQSFLPFYPW